MLLYGQSETHNLILNVNKDKTSGRQKKKMFKGNEKTPYYHCLISATHSVPINTHN